MKKKSLFAIIGAVAIINLLSRLVGFVREIVIGYHFGTSEIADSVIVAYTIPNFLYIVVGGAITTAFISVYSKTDDNRIKDELSNVIFTYTFLIAALISFVFFLFPLFWMNLFFSGLSDSQLKTTSAIFRIMSVSTVFLVLSMYFSGILNTKGRFRATAIAPLINNVLFVVIALIAFPIFAEMGYAWGAVIGSAAMGVLLWTELKKDDFHIGFSLKINHPEYAWRFLKISVPILLGGATLQFYFLVHRIFAASLEGGYLSALNYASKLTQLPQAVLMTAVTTVIYPLIAVKVANNETKSLENIYNDGLRYLLYLMIPVTLFIFFYTEDVVTLIFEYGSFDKESSMMTSGLLKIFVLGMFAHAANVYVTRFYYAMEKAFLPVLSGVIAVFGVNILIIVLFIEEFGAMAIAWGTTISAYFQFFLLILAAPSKLKLKIRLDGSLVRMGVLALFQAMIFLIISHYSNSFTSIFNATLGLFLLVLSFIGLSIALRIQEWQNIVNKIRVRKK
ncbi:murein biosynthesis integral membrane protein MurJ [Peribacillus loiseleuriae]|uniref:murein biosynthesis integral membrane protein MurJ n=1 Tax=Peribacillus loiseleuriae TaxID=1679170 RepID=UPI003CFED18C